MSHTADTGPRHGAETPIEGSSAHDRLLRVRDLSVRYGAAIRALEGVNIAVGVDECVAVLGGNGAGKSTLMRAVSGTLHRNGGAIHRGDIYFDAYAIRRWSADKRARAGVVQVPEGRRVFGRLTVLENLRAGGLSSSRTQATESLGRVYDMFPALADSRGKRAALLSGGEQQMLAIGRALMASPRLMLLDEPTLGLAPRIIDQIVDLLRDLRGQGIPMLLVEQNAAVALALADRAYVLSTGSVAISGSAEDLARDDRVRRLYLGDVSESFDADSTEVST